jgi:hypothetical protein
MGVHRPGELEKKLERAKARDRIPEEFKKLVSAPKVPSAVAKVFESRPGYANYYFNRLNRDRVLAKLERRPVGRWRFLGRCNGKEAIVTIADKAVAWESANDRFIYLPTEERTLDPPGTNGLLVALWHWRQLLTGGPKAFDDCRYAGSTGADAELVEATLGAVESRWRLARAGGQLVGGEIQVSSDGGPCDIDFFGSCKDQSGRTWPAKWTVGVDGKIGLVFDVERIEALP